MPGRWRANPDRLRDFLGALPAGPRCAFEFRDPSWFDAGIYRLLEERGAALCLYELAGRRAPGILTADFVYIRLHGPKGAYEGKYSFGSRFEEAPGTNPEELIGAAHAGCFSMFLSSLLSKHGTAPTRIAASRPGTPSPAWQSMQRTACP